MTYESQAVVVAEWNTLLDVVDGVGQATENFSQVAAHLHGDDAQVIFLVAPDQEGLGVIVVDTATRWPVTASVGSLQEAITFLEQEVVVDELLLDGLLHAGQWVEFTLELSLQARQGGGNLGFHFLVLGFGEAWVEGVTFHGATATDAGGNDEFTGWVQVSEDAVVAEVLGWVLVCLLEATMVVFDDWVEQVSEGGVGWWEESSVSQPETPQTLSNSPSASGA
jgi:hypothetical protein